MTHADRTGPGWRVRWARRENARRRRAHEDLVEAWCLRGIRLQRLRAAAEERPSLRPVVPVDLADDETVVAVQPSTGLVAVPRHAHLPPAALSAIPVAAEGDAPPLPEGSRVTEAGTAVVTDRRVVLVGRKRIRQWTYAELSGLTHHPTEPVTLLHGPTGALVAGLRVPRGAAARFRLRLTMAYADATRQRRVVLARLDEAVAANRRVRPPAPVLVSAASAPGYARFTRPAVAVAAGAVFVAAAAFAATTGSDPDRRPPTALPTDGGTVVVPAPTTPGVDTGVGPSASATSNVDPVMPGRPAPGPGGRAAGDHLPPLDRWVPPPTGRATSQAPQTSRPSPRPTPRPTAPTRTPSPTRPPTTPPTTRPTPSPTPAPTVAPVDRCGAPENPFGYTYCEGALVLEPAVNVCAYFLCVDGFWAGRGYLVQCGDGTIGMIGGRYGTCPERAGRKDPVYGVALHGRPATATARPVLVPVPSGLL